MPAPIHTPYDGSSKLFQIGLKPLDAAAWIDADHLLPAYLDEKDRLFAARPGDVFAAEAGTEAAQAEVLRLLAGHLPERFPDLYRRQGDAVVIVPTNRKVNLRAPDLPPLLTASQLVQEDLILMRQSETGWRLAAGSLSFPSSWSLAEKFGRRIDEIHGPVPAFGAGTRNAGLINRMFDNLRPEIMVIRWNWSIYGDGRLFHPESADPNGRRFGAAERAENVFLRVERQTLRKLPESRDILFTIRIYVDPLAALEQQPEAGTIARSLIAQLRALSDAQVAYKGLTVERDRLVARLAEVAR